MHKAAELLLSLKSFFVFHKKQKMHQEEYNNTVQKRATVLQHNGSYRTFPKPIKNIPLYNLYQ